MSFSHRCPFVVTCCLAFRQAHHHCCLIFAPPSLTHHSLLCLRSCCWNMGNKQISASKEGQMEHHGLFDGGSSNGGMTRTRSVRHQLEENTSSSSRDNKSYLPRMTPHGGGVVMPTMHNHHPHPPSSSSALNGGIDSPQWGWYTNLTPPSPQMYTAHAYPKRGVSSASVTSSDGSNNNNKPKRPSCTKPNPIFQSLPSQRKDRSTHPTMPL